MYVEMSLLNICVCECFLEKLKFVRDLNIWGVLKITGIGIGNGVGSLNSKPEQGCLPFTLGKTLINLFALLQL